MIVKTIIINKLPLTIWGFCKCWVTVAFHPAPGNALVSVCFPPQQVALMSAKAELGTGSMTWGCVSSCLPPAPQALRPVLTLDTGPVLVVLRAELFGCGCRAAFEVKQLGFVSCSQQKGACRVCAGRGWFVFHLLIKEKESVTVWSVCHPVRPKGQDPPVIPCIGRGRRQRVVVKAPQTQLRPLWQDEHTTSRYQGCSAGHLAAQEWTGSLIPLALHFPGVRKYSGWRYSNVSLYSWCNCSLFLNRWYFHSCLSQQKSGVNLGTVTWLYWSLWKCTHKRSQAGPVLTEGTALGEQNMLWRHKYHDPAFDMGSSRSPMLWYSLARACPEYAWDSVFHLILPTYCFPSLHFCVPICIPHSGQKIYRILNWSPKCFKRIYVA